MTRGRRLALLALLLAVPLLSRAAEPAKEPQKPAGSGGEAEKLTFEPSAWLLLNAYSNRGGFSDGLQAVRYAAGPSTDSGLNATARQSRLRAKLGIPTDGLLGGAKLSAFAEVDFAGAMASAADQSTPQLRLRHAFAAATWKDLGNLTLIVGQTWGLLEGTNFAVTLSHLAVPRFGGAGDLFRRAPQVRVQGDLPASSAVKFTYQLAVLAPVGAEAQTVNVAGVAEQVGEHSNRPNGEARFATIVSPAAGTKLELGVSGHYGRERFQLKGVSPTASKELDSKAVALDGKLDFPYVTLLGGAYTGENLDIYYAAAPGVIATTNATGMLDVRNVKTRGGWVQAVVSPIVPLKLLAGFGAEAPNARGFAATNVAQNRQASTGVLYQFTGRWQAGVEFTRYFTRYGNGTRFDSSQVEVSTLLSI